MEDLGTPVDDAMAQQWTTFALTIRTYERIVGDISTPVEGTPFARADDLYPSESISQWCREGLRSALDHLGLWADRAVPLHMVEEQVVQHAGFRSYFTLLRAGLEGAAQSLWLSGSASAQEALARLVRMVRHDLGEQANAWTAMSRDTSPVYARLKNHEAAAVQLSAFGPDTKRLPPMVDLVKSAATEAGADPSKYEAHWRLCSAAAHGKDWAIFELQTFTGERIEWRPGQFHMVGVLDATKLTEILSDTIDLVGAAVHRYLDRSWVGDHRDLIRRSAFEIAKVTPQKDDGAHVEHVAREMGLLGDDGSGTQPESDPSKA